jgi:2-polyprenyl-3-methyl-5-hydroxy-6-metoxy-1,4-benzoquinol methylase
MTRSVPCALCDVDDAEHLLTKSGHDLVQCRRCGLVYVNPPPPPSRLVELYSNETYEAHQRAADDAGVNAARDHARAALIARRHAGRRLLDVGCSTGSFLRAARAHDFTVSGIDLGRGNIERARAAGFDVRLAVLEEAPFAPRSFDVITLFDSIEHMPAPIAALAAARELLADDGLLVITTPNVGGLLPQLTWQLFGRTLGAWEHPTPPHHLFQFSRSTLRGALEKAGFAEVWARTERIPIDYTASELCDALLAAAKQRIARTSLPARQGARPAEASRESPDASLAGSRTTRPATATRFVRRVIRGGVATASWLVAGTISPLADLLDRGDSMLVMARKR